MAGQSSELQNPAGNSPESLMEEIPVEKIENFENLSEYVPTNPGITPEAANPSGGESLMEEPPIEKVEAFESLDSYSPTDSGVSSQSPSPEAAPESLMVEPPIEKIDAFENLDDYTPTQPQLTVEPNPASSDTLSSPDPLAANDAFPTTEPTPQDAAPGLEDIVFDTNNPSNPTEPSQESQSALNNLPSFEFEESEKSLVSIPAEGAAPAEGQATAPEPGATQDSFSPLESPAAADAPIEKDQPQATSTENQVTLDTPPPPAKQEAPTQAPVQESKEKIASASVQQTPLRPAQSSSESFEKIKKYAETPVISHPPVPAAFPFSLLIEGHLLPHEKSKLLDILSRQNMGIREIDLEPQFLSGRVLIPRISEYAGIVLIQALRETQTRLRFGPSETIFASSETQAEPTPSTAGEGENQSTFQLDPSGIHPAELIPISREDLSEEALSHYTLIDTVVASELIQSNEMEVSHSRKFQELLEALQKELRYKAFHKGATSILNFKVQVIPLSSPKQYRLLVLGSAVKNKNTAS